MLYFTPIEVCRKVYSLCWGFAPKYEMFSGNVYVTCFVLVGDKAVVSVLCYGMDWWGSY